MGVARTVGMTLAFASASPLALRAPRVPRAQSPTALCAMSAPTPAPTHTLDLGGRRLVLGTSSKWRRHLFTTHFPCVRVECLSPSIDEKAFGGARSSADARPLTLRVAHAKADALLARARADGGGGLLLAADQVVVGPEGVREKPADEDECRRFLRSYARGDPVRAVSGLVVVDVESGGRFEAGDEARQWFREFPEEVVEGLVREGECMKAAGGVIVEHALLRQYVGRREGELESIQGMPVEATRGLLEKAVRAAEEQKGSK